MIELPHPLGVILNVGVWLLWSVGVGYVGHRRSTAGFAIDNWWSQLRGFETDGSFHARVLRTRAWKHCLPELGGLFSDGFAKRAPRRHRDHLQRFVLETRRAEWVHWTVFLLWPVFALWNPPWAVAVMLVYATVTNVPCVVVQRYNRARLLGALRRARRLPSRRDSIVTA